MKTDVNFSLQSLAESNGLRLKWTDRSGQEHKISLAGLKSILKSLRILDDQEMQDGGRQPVSERSFGSSPGGQAGARSGQANLSPGEQTGGAASGQADSSSGEQTAPIPFQNVETRSTTGRRRKRKLSSLFQALVPDAFVLKRPYDQNQNDPLSIRINLHSDEVDSEAAIAGISSINFTIYEEHGNIRSGTSSTVENETGVFNIVVPNDVPYGYHRLKILFPAFKSNGSEQEQSEVERALIITPAKCYLPGGFTLNQRLWGPMVNLSSFRSKRNWGIGDLTDLKNIIGFCAAQGAGAIGVSPLHAQLTYGGKASPRVPSHRGFIAYLYIDVEAVEDFRQCEEARRLVASPEFQKTLEELRQSEVADVHKVAQVKLKVLDKLYQHFRTNHLHRAGGRAREFRAFQQRRGRDLRYLAVYNAISESLLKEEHLFQGWLSWPEKYRDPSSQAVRDFIAANNERIEFYEYVQWQADKQISAIGTICLNSRLPLGLILEISPLTSHLGAEVWQNPDLFAESLRLAEAPRPELADGHVTAAPPVLIDALRRAGYQPLVQILKESMQNAGAIKLRGIAHWLTPIVTTEEMVLNESVVLRRPIDEILGIIALESHRNFAMVILDDDAASADPEVDLCKILQDWDIFLQQDLLNNEPEKIEERLLAPGLKPAGMEQIQERRLLELAPPTLSPLASFWQGADLHALAESDQSVDKDKRDLLIDLRVKQRVEVLRLLENSGLLPEGATPDPASVPAATPALVAGIMSLAARSSAAIVLFRLEDLALSAGRTIASYYDRDYPNWRVKLAPSFDELIESEVTELVVEQFQSERGCFFDHLELVPPVLEVQAGRQLTIPSATYRLQMGGSFKLTDLERMVDYFAALGISHLYLSPILEARPGSPHGYDIINHKRLNPEIGNELDLARLSERLKASGMGIILDLVPNHMGIGKHNQWWMDVLEHGPASEHAEYFDIDWSPVKKELYGKVLLPILGEPYGKVIREGQLKFAFNKEAGKLSVNYYEHELPLNPVSYPLILGRRLRVLNERLGADNMDVMEYLSILEALSRLPEGMGLSNEDRGRRLREFKVACRRLSDLCASNNAIVEFIEQNLGEFEAGEDDSAATERVHTLLERQGYRLAFWRVAAHEINYRRFFDINDLAGVRVEDRRAFLDMHEYVFKLVEERKVDGLRIDHPDGLFDPSGYFRQIQEEAERRLNPGREPYNGTPTQFARQQDLAIYLIGEKILAPYERMEQDWLIHGTTGYDFLNSVNGVLIDTNKEAVFNEFYESCVSESPPYEELVYKSKHLIMQTSLSSELNVLAHNLDEIAESNWMYRDFTLNSLRHALSEVVAYFPVYRTYVKDGTVSDVAVSYIGRAVRKAKQNNLTIHPAIFDFIEDVLTLRLVDGVQSVEENSAFEEEVLGFAMKFQQFTGPVMAKSLEDTLFYKYNRFVGLNEVGGEPDHFGLGAADFHFFNEERHRQYPHSMLATSTHDTKRSEDVRARLTVLSEIPDNWQERVLRWMDYNVGRYAYEADRKIPTNNDEYLLYQTLVGTYPLELKSDDDLNAYRERIEAYMIKAVREAKDNSSWINPDQAYEDGLRSFIRELLQAENLGEKPDPFFVDFLEFHNLVSRLGLIKSMVQTVLKFTCPGVPDIYQGNELFDFSLVDPDNRRPVDLSLRDRLLQALRPYVEAIEEKPAEERARFIKDLLKTAKDGRIKLYLTARMLRLRREDADLFTTGRYIPIGVSGEGKDYFVAFARQRKGRTALVLAPVMVSNLITPDHHTLFSGPEETGFWTKTKLTLPRDLQSRSYLNVLTGEPIAIGERRPTARLLLDKLPVAVLISG